MLMTYFASDEANGVGSARCGDLSASQSKYFLRRLTALAGAVLLLAGVVLPISAQAQSYQSRLPKKVVSIKTDEQPGSIIVSFGDRKLYKITEGGRAIAYPIGVPKSIARWDGTLKVTQKRKNPPWRPTASMLKKNPMLPTYVPGGHPLNPMGVRALYLGHTFYRIHGTDAPWTIGKAASSGCVRMYNEDAIDLYDRTKVGAKVVVTWQQFDTRHVASLSKASEQDRWGSRRRARRWR